MTKLDELLKAARAIEVRAEQDRQAAIAGQVEQARAAIAAAFDGLWEEVAPHADNGNYWLTNGKDSITTWWTVIRMPGLAEFSAAATFNRGHVSVDSCFIIPYDDPSSVRSRYTFKSLPEFLLERKRVHEQAAAEALAKLISEAQKKLNGHSSQRAHSPEDAEAAREELNALAPGRIDEWSALCLTWKRDYDNVAAQRAEEESVAAYKAQSKYEYETNFRAFWSEYRRVLEINRGRLDALQAELDTPFQAWKLTYGICAEDEDNGTYAGVATAWVLTGEPDRDGYWPGVDDGRPSLKRFYHLVSIEGPVTMRPTDHRVYDSVHLDAPPDPGWFTLYFHPGADRGEIACQAAALLDPWPAWPLAPDGLDHWEVSRIQARVTGGESGCDIPF